MVVDNFKVAREVFEVKGKIYFTPKPHINSYGHLGRITELLGALHLLRAHANKKKEFK